MPPTMTNVCQPSRAEMPTASRETKVDWVRNGDCRTPGREARMAMRDYRTALRHFTRAEETSRGSSAHAAALLRLAQVLDLDPHNTEAERLLQRARTAQQIERRRRNIRELAIRKRLHAAPVTRQD